MEETFEVGDKVRLVAIPNKGHHACEEWPLVGTDYECVGRIYYKSGNYSSVRWDNGETCGGCRDGVHIVLFNGKATNKETTTMTTIDISPIHRYPVFCHPVLISDGISNAKDVGVDLTGHPWDKYDKVLGYKVDDLFYVVDVHKEPLTSESKPSEQGYYNRLKDLYSTTELPKNVLFTQMLIVQDEEELINTIRQYATIGVQSVRICASAWVDPTNTKEVSLETKVNMKKVKDDIYEYKGLGYKIPGDAEVLEVSTYGVDEDGKLVIVL